MSVYGFLIVLVAKHVKDGKKDSVSAERLGFWLVVFVFLIFSKSVPYLYNYDANSLHVIAAHPLTVNGLL